ncbi:regulator of G-protein signaling 9-binding protein B isoform X2 [Microcaecilia unicolor]|uniref:Regulator of G-protein signaling 9-binding protein B-like isoform X2 n=1 Tax=Microcaecilia unicolor TaxID=1415580 RepID=A0A6P7WXR2_9AMPH|nr:regulator of G-protein signaling 9-binding protein B-like isoform X2 [Microcaecilia unicolor]
MMNRNILNNRFCCWSEMQLKMVPFFLNSFLSLHVTNVISDETVTSIEQKNLDSEIENVDRMIYDMEMKVNALWWTPEASAVVCDNFSSLVIPISLEE